VADKSSTMKNLILSALVVFSVNIMLPNHASAAEKTSPKAIAKQLKSVTAAELPAKAAQLISSADAKEKEATTVAVVKSAVGISPASAPAIVGAIAAANPDMAALAAKTAAALQPKQAVAIARAAAAAAPAKASQIVEAVGREIPSAYRDVAVAVINVAPKSKTEIMAAAVPTATAPAVEAVPASPTSPFRGPSIQPPYIPISTPPTNAPPGGGEVPPGGRNYAAP
jgi:hypothetical protein